ncbi:MAG: ATP synthase subunit C [Eubacterium sp.]|jgi:V/A-type H+-transporting ATPase subunit K|nr:ATP synthase subunit C [Eubacterium sp.]
MLINKILLFSLPLLAIAVIIIPFLKAVYAKKSGKKVNGKRVLAANMISFVGTMALASVIFTFVASAEAAEAVETSAGGLSDAMKYIGAALSTGLATIGTGIAVGGAAPAAIGATSEDDKNFTKALIFVALGEGVAIYGLLISILILFS